MAESHSYNVKLACELGINGAVMLQHFHFLQREKAANNKLQMEGTYVRRSTLALTTTYPYWSEKVIKKIVSDLEEKGLLFSDVINQNTYDRTKSYTLSGRAIAFFEGKVNSILSDCIVPNGTMDRPKRSDDIGPNGPMLNNYTDDYTSNYTDNSANAHLAQNEVILNVDSESNGMDFRTHSQYLKYKDRDKTQIEEKVPIKIAFNSKEQKSNDNSHRADALKKTAIQLKEEFIEELERKGIAQYYEPFKGVWLEWIRYKKEIKNTYKSAQSAATGFKSMLEKSEYNPEKALRIVETAIANCWKGMQEERKQFNSSGKNKIEQQHEDLVTYVMNKRNLLNGQ